jgi:hypothetical protein
MLRAIALICLTLASAGVIGAQVRTGIAAEHHKGLQFAASSVR